jgi:hypothetical protein
MSSDKVLIDKIRDLRGQSISYVMQHCRAEIRHEQKLHDSLKEKTNIDDSHQILEAETKRLLRTPERIRLRSDARLLDLLLLEKMLQFVEAHFINTKSIEFSDLLDKLEIGVVKFFEAEYSKELLPYLTQELIEPILQIKNSSADVSVDEVELTLKGRNKSVPQKHIEDRSNAGVKNEGISVAEENTTVNSVSEDLPLVAQPVAINHIIEMVQQVSEINKAEVTQTVLAWLKRALSKKSEEIDVSNLFIAAVAAGMNPCLTFMISKVGSSLITDEALRVAASHRQLEVCRLLIKHDKTKQLNLNILYKVFITTMDSDLSVKDKQKAIQITLIGMPTGSMTDFNRILNFQTLASLVDIDEPFDKQTAKEILQILHVCSLNALLTHPGLDEIVMTALNDKQKDLWQIFEKMRLDTSMNRDPLDAEVILRAIDVDVLEREREIVAALNNYRASLNKGVANFFGLNSQVNKLNKAFDIKSSDELTVEKFRIYMSARSDVKQYSDWMRKAEQVMERLSPQKKRKS